MLSRITGFILRPLVKPIRYGALKIMKKMHPPGDRRPAIAAAEHLLDEFILPSVFSTFQESRFRELAYFRKLPVSEHDRIFNELEVAGMCLGVFYLETAKALEGSDFHFWRDVEEHLPKQLQRKLVGYGVDGGNAKLMRQLIEMRYKEYDELAEQTWKYGGDKSSEFKDWSLEMRRIAFAVQAIAVGTTDHIRRGKLEEQDPLIRYLRKWLLILQRKIGKFVKRL